MNVHRILTTLQRVNAELARPQNEATHKVLKRGKRKYSKMLEQFTSPQAPARPLPIRNQLKLL